MKNQREIKFRVWDREDKLWVAGWSIQQSGILPDNGKVVFMQFTGLKDKNGKEIYEGDILEEIFPELAPLPKELIEKIPNGSFIHPSIIDGLEEERTYTEVSIPDIYFSEGTENAKVVGNIYENPELIK